MSAQMLQSLQGAFSGGQAADAGAGPIGPMSSSAGPTSTPLPGGTSALPPMSSANPQQAFYQQMLQNLQQQSSPTSLALQGMGDVGSAFINKNVMQKQLMPAPGNFGMATSQMGPLQLSPLLNYLKGLG